MQISRHWRMNSQRYRLEGVRFMSGNISLEDRPIPVESPVADEIVEAIAPAIVDEKKEVAA